jgi:hypothetical protein
MRFIKTIAMTLAAAMVLALPAQAQVNENFAEYAPDIEAARSILQTERKILIMREMSLTPAEADAFWPLYDEYVVARRELGDKRLGVITDYAANYQTMTNEMARDLADRSLKWESDVLKLKKKYVKKFRKVLPDTKVVRYFQLENKLDAIINFDLASQIPLME